MPATVSAVARPRSTAAAANPVRVDATTVVLNLDDDMVALAARAQNNRGDRGFPCRRALGAQLDAVIHRVAHDMEQRLEQHLDDRLVGFGLLALDDQPHRLRQRFRHLAHKARESLEHAAQRKNPQFQHGSLQPVDQAVELAVLVGDRRGERVVALPRQHRDVANGVFGDSQFSGEVHKRVHALGVDAQRAGQRIGANGDWLDRIGSGRVVQALHRRFNGAREAGRIEASEALRDGVGNPFGDVGAPQMAKDIGGHTPGRRDPTLQSLAADGEQRDLLAQNGERDIGGLRLRCDDGRFCLRRLDRRGARLPLRQPAKRAASRSAAASASFGSSPLSSIESSH